MARGRLLHLEALLDECCAEAEEAAQHSVRQQFRQLLLRPGEGSLTESSDKRSKRKLLAAGTRAHCDEAGSEQHEEKGSGDEDVMHGSGSLSGGREVTVLLTR